MKKILIAVLMGVAFTGNANAVEFEINGDAVLQNVIKQVVAQTIGNTVKTGGGQVVVHTGKTVTTGKMTKCWNSPKYDSQGNMTMRLVCY